MKNKKKKNIKVYGIYIGIFIMLAALFFLAASLIKNFLAEDVIDPVAPAAPVASVAPAEQTASEEQTSQAESESETESEHYAIPITIDVSLSETDTSSQTPEETVFEMPDTSIETHAPETPAPETPAPETPAPETPAPETPAPETPVPETPVPETLAPETPAPETPAPETPAPIPETPVQPNGKVVYLTFDDGPGEATGDLLDILKRYNVKATFFVVGCDPKYRHYMSMIAENGHAIGIHTYTHDYQTIYTSTDAYFNDLQKISDLAEEQTGIHTNIMRFPGGSSNSVSKKYCAGIMTKLSGEVLNRGYQYFDWNVSSGDGGGNITTEQTVQNVIDGISKHDESIVLMHDTHRSTVNAVPAILDWCISNGYTMKVLTKDGFTVHHNIAN